jgi:hypothetical protein
MYEYLQLLFCCTPVIVMLGIFALFIWLAPQPRRPPPQ